MYDTNWAAVHYTGKCVCPMCGKEFDRTADWAYTRWTGDWRHHRKLVLCGYKCSREVDMGKEPRFATTAATQERIIRLYESGKSMSAIAKEFCVSQPTIRRVLKETGHYVERPSGRVPAAGQETAAQGNAAEERTEERMESMETGTVRTEAPETIERYETMAAPEAKKEKPFKVTRIDMEGEKADYSLEDGWLTVRAGGDTLLSMRAEDVIGLMEELQRALVLMGVTTLD